MKYSILGFNQEEVIKISELDLTDLLLLQYIKDAIASPTMQHRVDTMNVNYVWLYHEKILEDLPILNIKENMLSKRLKKLCDLDLIKSLHVSNENKRGSKAFYTITERCEYLYMSRPDVKNYMSSDDHIENITSGQARPDVKNYKSDSILVKKDKQLNIDNKETFEFGKTKEVKQSLYTKCIAEINSRNYSKSLHDALIDYLQVRLQIKDKPLYANSWKGLLNKLERDFKEEERIGVVFQSIERGYASFFPVSTGWRKNNDSQLDKPWEQGVSCKKATKDEEAENERWRAECRAKGIRVDY